MKIELASQRPTKVWLLGLTFLSLLLYAGFTMSSRSSAQIRLSALELQTVNQASIDIYASAYGELASASERLLTAPAQGKVSAILIRPGTKVKPNSTIIVLSNPKLEQEVTDAKGQLANLNAQLEAFKYEQQNQRLNYQSNIADIEAELEKAELELSVNKNLQTLGVASKIELQRAKLSVKQQTKRLDFEKKKYQQFVEMQGYQLTQRRINIEQQMARVNILQQQFDDMEVKADINGTLQSLDVELGQSVNLGEAIAKVGSDTDLIAKLRLPQYQADQIDLGATVTINTSKGLIAGNISRIESIVTDGSILAEATLSGELTSNARPSLGISAQIFLRHEEQALFIEQTTGLRPRSKFTAYVKTDDSTLEKRDITLGDLSNNKVLIQQGLQQGDQIVTSNMDAFQSFNRIEIRP